MEEQKVPSQDKTLYRMNLTLLNMKDELAAINNTLQELVTVLGEKRED